MSEEKHTNMKVQAAEILQNVLQDVRFTLSDVKIDEASASKADQESEINLAEWDGKTYGQILLNSRNALFEIISRTENLDQLMKYFLVRFIVFAGIYGVCLGGYSLNLQIVASAIKMPLLLLGTMGICLPALFTFNMLLGSKLNMRQTVSLLLVSNYLLAFILASLSPILVFFAIATPDKHFISLLNLTFCALSGVFFLMFLWSGMRYLTRRAGVAYNPHIIQIWSLIYMFVGTQFSWLLRPFIGDRGAFALFRDIEGNFYVAVVRIIVNFIDKIV